MLNLATFWDVPTKNIIESEIKFLEIFDETSEI